MKDDGSNRTTSRPWSLFLTVRLASGVFLGVLAIVTVFANVGLLATLWKRRNRPLKTPTMFFFLGIAVADLITGLVIEPAFSICFMSSNLSTCQMEIRETIHELVVSACFASLMESFSRHSSSTCLQTITLGASLSVGVKCQLV